MWRKNSVAQSGCCVRVSSRACRHRRRCCCCWSKKMLKSNYLACVNHCRALEWSYCPNCVGESRLLANQFKISSFILTCWRRRWRRHHTHFLHHIKPLWCDNNHQQVLTISKDIEGCFLWKERLSLPETPFIISIIILLLLLSLSLSRFLTL